MGALPEFDDPARVSDYGTLPGERDWSAKQQRQYEARVKELAQTYTDHARIQIEAVIDGRADECEVMTYEGVRRVDVSDLFEMLVDAERYVSGYQWRYYLDIFDCDVFRWNVFEMRKIESATVGVDEYDVFAFHRLEQSRYPGMHDDCLQLALDFYDVAAPLLPEYKSRLEVA